MDDARANVRRLMKSGSFRSSNGKKLLPVLLIPARVFANDGYEGLGMIAGESMVGDPMLSFPMEISSMGMIVFASVCTLGVDCNLLPTRGPAQQMSQTEQESRIFANEINDGTNFYSHLKHLHSSGSWCKCKRKEIYA